MKLLLHHGIAVISDRARIGCSRLILAVTLAASVALHTGCSTAGKPRRHQFIPMQELTPNAARALSLLGIQRESNMVVSSGEETKAKVIPFIPSIGIERVRIENVNWVSTRTKETLTNRFVRTIDVLFDKKTGQPVRIESLWPDNVSGTRFPPLGSYEAQLKLKGQEIVGIPLAPPKVPLHDAMRHVMGFVTAKQIIVFLAMEADPPIRKQPRPVWIIHAWGCAPVPLAGTPNAPQSISNEVSEDALNHLRTIVDAETGEYYGTDSIPQPEL